MSTKSPEWPLRPAEKVYLLLLSIFITMLLLTNVITAKYFQCGQVVLTAGALTYPFTFSLLDIISELYSRPRAQIVVWLGFVGSVCMVCMVFV